jgi:flagellar export protein FliJ
MTFRFRGARILEWRRVQADAARVAFVRATESVREAAVRVAEADNHIDRAAGDYKAAMARPNEIGTIVGYRNWIQKQREHAAACRRQHEEKRVVADQAAGVLQIAMRRVKVMERLRDRAWRRHLDAERQREMKELDALATQQFARRKSEQGANREC